MHQQVNVNLAIDQKTPYLLSIVLERRRTCTSTPGPVVPKGCLTSAIAGTVVLGTRYLVWMTDDGDDGGLASFLGLES